MASMEQEISFNSTAPINAYISMKQKSDRHWHKNLELNYVLTGQLKIQIREQTYFLEKDQMILVNSYDPHVIDETDCVLAVMTIDLSKFDQNLVKEGSLRFDCNCATRQEQELFTPLKSMLARFIQINSVEDEYNEFLNKSLSYSVLHYLIKVFRIETSMDYGSQHSHISRMEEVIKYINQNYTRYLTLNDLAKEFYITVPYMSKIFKDYFGCSFKDYMNSIRLSHALNDLGNNTLSIDMIAERSGFPNTRSFVTAFKSAYGELPSTYRKNMPSNRKTTLTPSQENDYLLLSHHHYLEGLTRYLNPTDLNNFHTIPTPRPAQVIETPSISVAQKGFLLRHTFKNTTSIGKAKLILYAENQQMLRQIQEEIGFKYIKFNGILDDDMMIYSEAADGSPQLNFTYLDMIMDFLLSIKLRPFIQFSFMPRALAKDRTRTHYYTESVISLPKDMDKWNYLIRELVLHLESRYGSEEVEKWPFSLWNQPDSPKVMFGFESCAEYYNFYENTYRTVKACNPLLIFGAPSVLPTTLTEGNWINDFLLLCKENDCVPEFLNFHFYPIANKTETLPSNAQMYSHFTYQKSPDALRECIYMIKRNAKEFNWNIDTLYMTEWSSSISHRELLNDTAYKAAYVVKNILDNYDHLDSFGYWVLSDFIEEVKMSGELFHGGLGLFTYNGIKKSHYYALKLISKLGNRLIGRGDGYFITKEKECFQIILYNYQHFSDLYASGELFDMTFTNRYTPFPTAIRKKYVIPLADIANQEYLLTETIINRNHGSVFDKWAELGALPLETQDDISYLKSVSVPLIKKRRLSVENNHLTVSCELEPHEVRFIEIRAQYR